MKKFIIFLLLIALGGGFIYWKYYYQVQKEDAPKPKTAKVERGTIFSIVDTSGKVESNRDVEIKCKSSGQVIKLPFEMSDFVRSSQLLVELDPVDEQRAVQQAQVGLSASRAKLAQAKQNLTIAETRLETDKKKNEANWKAAQAKVTELQAKLQRLKVLLQSKLTSQQDYEATEASYVDAVTSLDRSKISIDELKLDEMALDIKRQDIRLAQAEVELDEIALSTAEQRLRETKVFAPCDGFISERKIQIGQIISSGISNVGGGTSIMTVSDLSRIFVVASVDESDIGRIALNQPVLLATDAFQDQQFPGKVVQISTKGLTTSNVVTFEVRIEVLGESKKLLKPEMTAAIKIIADEKNNTLLIPSEAIYQKTAEEIENEQQANVATDKPTDNKNNLANVATNKPTDNKNNTDTNKPTDNKNVNPTLVASPQSIKPEHTGKLAKNPDNHSSDTTSTTTTTPNPKTPADTPAISSNNHSTNNRLVETFADAPVGLTKEKVQKIYSTRLRRHFVQLSKSDDTTEEREVVIGIDDGTKTEILSGLEENDVIIVEKGYIQSKWQNSGNMQNRRMVRQAGGPPPH